MVVTTHTAKHVTDTAAQVRHLLHVKAMEEIIDAESKFAVSVRQSTLHIIAGTDFQYSIGLLHPIWYQKHYNCALYFVELLIN